MKYIHNTIALPSIRDFGSMTGVMNPAERNVWFVRALGAGIDYANEIRGLDSSLLQSMREGKLLYKRIKALPNMMLNNDADFYAGCYAGWSDSRKTRIKTKVTARNGQLCEALGRALSETVAQYRKIKAGVSETMERNFAVKLMYWFDSVMQDFLIHWDENSVVRLAVQNVTKEQEYLFYYMLTLVGADILMLQSKADIETAQSVKELSAQLVLGAYTDAAVPEFSPIQSEPQRQQNPSQSNAAGGANNSDEKIRMVIPKRADRRAAVNRAAAANTLSGRTQNTNMNSNQALSTSESVKTEKSFEELAQLASSVVMITMHDNKGKIIGSGSGIMIGKGGYILTNNHVASGGRYYTVKIEEDDNTYTTDEVIKYNPVLDLAVIRIDRPLNPLRIYSGARKLVRGQKVVAIGSPLGLFNSVSDGIISGFRKLNDVDMIQFTAPISNGSSGGAVLNMYGEVIGISTAGFDDGQNINLAVGYEFINMFVRGFV